MRQEHKEIIREIQSLGERTADGIPSSVICPDCDGTGVITGIEVMPECCGRFDKYGGCCNSPLMGYYPVPEQCHRCMASGRLTDISKLTKKK